MATYIPVTNLPTQFMDSNGDPLVSGTLEFYLSGTSTATDLFTSDGTTIGTSITLNSWGYPESGGALITLFRDQSKALKIVAKNAAGATIFTTDGIPAVASFDATSSAKLDFITVTQAVDLDAIETSVGTAYQVDGSVALTADVTIPAAKFLNLSVTAGIVASITQTQAGGTALVSGINEVATVTNANDAATMPKAAAGRMCFVFNNGANTLQLFPFLGDTFNTLTVNSSTTLTTTSNALFVCFNGTTWELT